MRNFKLTAVSLQNNAHTGPRCDTWVERWNCSTPKSHSFRGTNEYLKTADRKSHQLIFPYWMITDSTAAYLPGITGLWRHLLLSGQKQENHQTKKPWARCVDRTRSSVHLFVIYLLIFWFFDFLIFWFLIFDFFLAKTGILIILFALLKKNAEILNVISTAEFLKTLEEKQQFVAFSSQLESMYIKQSFSLNFSTICGVALRCVSLYCALFKFAL